MQVPSLPWVHHNTFYFSLNWLVLWHWGGKHVNYAKRQQELRKKIWNDETKSRTKQRTHKFYESLTYLTAIMSCFSSPQGSGYTSARAPPPTGLFWAEFLILRCWDVGLYEDLKWRFTWKEKVDGPDCGWGWLSPRTGARPRASFHHNCDFHIEWCIDWRSSVSSYYSKYLQLFYVLEIFLITGDISSYWKYFSSLGKKTCDRTPSQSLGKKFETKTAFGLISPCLPEHLQNERVKLSDGLRHTHYKVMRFPFCKSCGRAPPSPPPPPHN